MKSDFLLPVLIGLLVLVATASGLFYKTTEAHWQHTTVRGQQAIFQGHGLYRYDPAVVAREGIIWDAINLFIALPLFAVAILLGRRNSRRGRLLLGGLLFYFFYVYLMYATMIAFNRLFLVYVAIFALCPVAFLPNLKHIDVSGLPGHFSARFPRRLFIGFAFAMGTALTLLWLGRVIPIMFSGQFPAELAGMTTLVTQALDLGLIVPLAIGSGVLLWRRSAWGYLLAGICLTFGLMLFITIPAWIAVPLIQDGKIDPIEAVPFLALSLVGLFLAGAFFRNVHEEDRLPDRG